MSDEPKKRSRALPGLVVLLLFVLYPASYGPASWLNCVDDSGRVYKPYIIIYRPLRWATGQSRGLQTAMNKYVGWGVRSVTGGR